MRSVKRSGRRVEAVRTSSPCWADPTLRLGPSETASNTEASYETDARVVGHEDADVAVQVTDADDEGDVDDDSAEAAKEFIEVIEEVILDAEKQYEEAVQSATGLHYPTPSPPSPSTLDIVDYSSLSSAANTPSLGINDSQAGAGDSAAGGDVDQDDDIDDNWMTSSNPICADVHTLHPQHKQR